MAGEINKELSRQLALKLQDPVDHGDEDTMRIPASSRLSLLKRGLYKMMRVLSTSYPKLIRVILSSYITYGKLRSNSQGIIDEVSFILELYSVYVKRPDEERYLKARIIDPSLWIDIKTSQNDLYIPDISKGNYFACRINGLIEIEPAIELECMLYFMKSIGELSYNANDIAIAEHYWDILLNYSAAEHYLDLGQLDFVQAFRSQSNEDLQILLIKKKEDEAKDDKN